MRIVAFLLALPASALLLTGLASGETRAITGRVTAVADGDSLTVTDAARRSYRVRLQGIDAPERGQPFSAASKAALSRRVFAQEVVVVSGKIDRYGRMVGVISVAGRDPALEQLRAGMAWFYVRYENELSVATRSDYMNAVRLARRDRLGLWSEPSPIPPWTYRRSHPR